MRQLRRYRLPLVLGYDVAAWLAAYAAFAWLRFDSDADQVPWGEILAVGLGSAALFLVLGGLVRLHQGRAATASLEEMVLLGAVTVWTGAIVFAINLETQWVPRSVPAGAVIGALVIAAWGRATWRRLKERDDESAGARGCHPRPGDRCR